MPEMSGRVDDVADEAFKVFYFCGDKGPWSVSRRMGGIDKHAR